MADDVKPEEIPGMYKREVKREGPISTILQILIGAGVVVGGLFFYWQFSVERERIATLVTEARDASKGDDAVNLLVAKQKYMEVGEDNLRKDDRAIAQMAELTAQLFALYGMADMQAEAKDWTGLAVEKDISKAERFAAEAYLALGENRPQDAERVVTDLEKRGIRHPKLLHALSLALLAQGKAREAQKAAEESMKLDTALVRLPIAHGDALLAQGNFSSAKNAYEKAKTLNPAHMRARTASVLVQAAAREGSEKLQHKELKKLRQEASEINEGKPPPRTVAFIEYVDGEVYMSWGKAKDALKLANKAVELDPSLTDALALKARALAARKKSKKALAAINEALAKVPTSIPYAQAGFEMLHRNKKTKDGVKLLEKVQKANPDNPRIYPLLAVAQAKAGQKKKAAESAKKAIEKLGNAHPDALFAEARAFQAAGDLKKAQEKYNEAMQEKGPTTPWPEVFYEMGFVRMQEKDYVTATTLFSTAVKQWEKARASVWDIADGYDAWAQSVEKQGGRKNKRAAAELKSKAKSIRSGKK